MKAENEESRTVGEQRRISRQTVHDNGVKVTVTWTYREDPIAARRLAKLLFGDAMRAVVPKPPPEL